MSQLALVAIHGMGDTNENYADRFFSDVRRGLGTKNSQLLHTASVFYQDILQENQEAYFKKVQRRVDWKKLRKFMLYGFCDAASLESQKEGPESPYFIAQSRIFSTLRQVYQTLQGDDRALIVVAQSLGGQVLSNYLWDASRATKPSYGVWSNDIDFQSEAEEASFAFQQHADPAVTEPTPLAGNRLHLFANFWIIR